MAGEPVQVKFSAFTSDLDGVVVLYQWDFDGDGIYDVNESQSLASYYLNLTTLPNPFTPRLRVQDDVGAWSEVVDITVLYSEMVDCELPRPPDEPDDDDGFLPGPGIGVILFVIGISGILRRRRPV